MKKGQKVRVKSNNKVGIIADSDFFALNGRKEVRYQVKFEDTNTSCWYPKDQLTSPIEKAKVIVSGENGELTLEITMDRSKSTGYTCELTGSPENLKEHKGTHVHLMSMFIESMGTVEN